MTGPCSAFSCGWRPLRRSEATRRKWVGAGAVLVHDSQGGGAQGVTLQPPLTLAVDVTRLMGQPCGGPTGHLDGLSCMRHAVG